MRNHRLRERRIKLGQTQWEIGALAGFRVNSAQMMVSRIERGLDPNPSRVRAVRAAIVWLESRPRRERQWQREDDAAAAATERAIAGGFAEPSNRETVTNRLVDLLIDGRHEEYDAMIERVPDDVVAKAGDIYLDLHNPKP